MKTDRQLFEAWADGDPDRGSELFRRHFDGLYRFFSNKVGDAAEDLVQQTFLACVRHRDGFRHDASFRTYLFRVARTKLYDHLVKVNKDSAIDFGMSTAVDLGAPPIDEIVEHRQETRLLIKALRQLPLELQIALELYYVEQLRSRELAEVLDIPHGTVRSRLRRGRVLLREKLEALTDDRRLIESTVEGLRRDDDDDDDTDPEPGPDTA